jgi:molecular chaperone DnaJ
MGTTIEKTCSGCRGEGRREQAVTFNIQIPAGVENGSTMRLTDKGPAGRRGGANGRLFVHLQVADDERFERHGDDLHHEAHVSFAQATLGAVISVPTLSGTTEVTLEPGTQNATVHRLRSEGVTHLHSRGRGDLYVHVVVDIPTSLGAESERLLREFAAAQGETIAEPAHGVFHRRKGRS